MEIGGNKGGVEELKGIRGTVKNGWHMVLTLDASREGECCWRSWGQGAGCWECWRWPGSWCLAATFRNTVEIEEKRNYLTEKWERDGWLGFDQHQMRWRIAVLKEDNRRLKAVLSKIHRLVGSINWEQSLPIITEQTVWCYFFLFFLHAICSTDVSMECPAISFPYLIIIGWFLLFYQFFFQLFTSHSYDAFRGSCFSRSRWMIAFGALVYYLLWLFQASFLNVGFIYFLCIDDVIDF